MVLVGWAEVTKGYEVVDRFRAFGVEKDEKGRCHI